jgi:hypothetical protein
MTSKLEESPRFWRNLSPPSSELKGKPSKKPSQAQIAACLPLKTKVIHSSKISGFLRATQHYNPEFYSSLVIKEKYQ